jgi:hydroxymethylbilane synthase
MTSDNTIRLGTRGSDLALWQTEHVRSLLEQAWPGKQFEIEIITTRGDVVLDTPLPLIGGKGVFTAELEAALREGAIGFAVHSLKDLPTEAPDGLVIGAVTERASVVDVLVSRSGQGLDALPPGAAVGTSSTRRAAQLLRYRPSLNLLDLRGNVPTRVRKALDPDGPYDAVVLARAGLERLGMLDAVTEELPLDIMLPAPGQGALAVQCRDEAPSLALLQPLNHAATWAAVSAERAFLAGLGGGCAVPVAAYAFIDAKRLHLYGRVLAVDGSAAVEVSGETDTSGEPASDVRAAQQLGAALARRALDMGAEGLLAAK